MPEQIVVEDYTRKGCYKALEKAARQFVKRVEAGEVRSSHTYKTFKEILIVLDEVEKQEG